MLLEQLRSNPNYFDARTGLLDLSYYRISFNDSNEGRRFFLNLPKLIAELNHYPEITSLDLSDNNTFELNNRFNIWNWGDKAEDDFFMEIVNVLAANKTLKVLKMRNCYLNDEMMEKLATNTTLTELDVSDNNISYKGAMALYHNNHLLKLAVSSHSLHENEKIAKYVAEPNPYIRTNNKRRAGIEADVPSLLQLSIFKAKQLPTIKEQVLEESMLGELISVKIPFYTSFYNFFMVKPLAVETSVNEVKLPDDLIEKLKQRMV